MLVAAGGIFFVIIELENVDPVKKRVFTRQRCSRRIRSKFPCLHSETAL